MALITYLLVLSDVDLATVLPIVVVLLVATVAGTLATFAALYALLAPVRAASAAVRDYLEERTLPRLPSGEDPGSDTAARLMADVQEGLTRLDFALSATEAAKDDSLAEKREIFGALSRLSHDLRTPLNAIVGFSQMMHNEMLGPIGTKAYRGYARDIEASGQQLLQRIQSILDLSQIAAEDVPAATETVDVDRGLDEAVRAKHLHASSCGVELSEPALSRMRVVSDRSALVQAMMNLIGVAIETTPRGGRVSVSATDSKDGVILSVADSGRPLSAADVPEGLAERGHLAEKGASASPEDIGDATSVSISLMLADRLAILCGGDLRWYHVEGKGKIFHLVLPRAEAGNVRQAA